MWQQLITNALHQSKLDVRANDLLFMTLYTFHLYTRCVTKIRTNRTISLNEILLTKKIEYCKKFFYISCSELYTEYNYSI